MAFDWGQMENHMQACVKQAKTELGNVGLFAITYRAQQLYRASYPSSVWINAEATDEQQESEQEPDGTE